MQEVGVVLVGEPTRLPGLVEPDPEPVGVNLLAHRILLSPLLGRRGLLGARPFRGRGAVGRDGRDACGRSATSTVRCVVRFTTRTHGPSGPDAALHRRAVVGVAGRHVEALDVAAEAVLLLAVRHRRTQHLGHVAGHGLPRELQGGERRVDVLAADQVEHQPRLLGGGADVLRGRLGLDHG